MIEIIKNYLKNEIFIIINKEINSPFFPLYFSDYVTHPSKKDGFMFCHTFYNKGITSTYFEKIIIPLLKPLKVNNLIRAKLNFYTKQTYHVKHDFHVDDKQEHKVALYSLNTNNGYTEFENFNLVKSIENQMCLFDGKLKHRSVTQTDKNSRINININFN